MDVFYFGDDSDSATEPGQGKEVGEALKTIPTLTQLYITGDLSTETGEASGEALKTYAKLCTVKAHSGIHQALRWSALPKSEGFHLLRAVSEALQTNKPLAVTFMRIALRVSEPSDALGKALGEVAESGRQAERSC